MKLDKLNREYENMKKLEQEKSKIQHEQFKKQAQQAEQKREIVKKIKEEKIKMEAEKNESIKNKTNSTNESKKDYINLNVSVARTYKKKNKDDEPDCDGNLSSNKQDSI